MKVLSLFATTVFFISTSHAGSEPWVVRAGKILHEQSEAYDEDDRRGLYGGALRQFGTPAEISEFDRLSEIEEDNRKKADQAHQEFVSKKRGFITGLFLDESDEAKEALNQSFEYRREANKVDSLSDSIYNEVVVRWRDQRDSHAEKAKEALTALAQGDQAGALAFVKLNYAAMDAQLGETFPKAQDRKQVVNDLVALRQTLLGAAPEDAAFESWGRITDGFLKRALPDTIDLNYELRKSFGR